jgi:ribosomal protein S18 acetylase RimI-like enzyme
VNAVVAEAVRAGTRADLESVARHYAHADSPWDPFGDVERLARIPLDGLLIGEVDGQYAGFLYWFEGHSPYFRPGLQRFGYLHELHVKPEYRGRGLAKRLIERFVEDALARGIHQLFVDTDDINSVARKLYESFGFHRYRDVVHYELEV